MKNILIFDPGLGDQAGHNFTSVMRISEEVVAHNHQGLIIGSTSSDRLSMKLPIQNTLSFSLYMREAWDTTAFLKHAIKMAQEFPDLRQFDAVFLPTGDQIQAMALALALQKTPNTNLKVVTWLLFSPRYFHDPYQSASQAAECRYAFTNLVQQINPHNISVFCETKTLLDFYHEILPVSVQQQPSPSVVGKKRIAEGATKVMVAGCANDHKDYRILPLIAKRLANVPNVKLYVQHYVRAFNRQIIQSLEHQLRAASNVVYLLGSLGNDDYQMFIESADLILLPYSSPTCHWRGSGIFNEAEHLGIPVVASADCHFARSAVAAGRCVLSSGNTGESIADAVEQALQQLPRLKENCAQRAAQQPQNFLSDFFKENFGRQHP